MGFKNKAKERKKKATTVVKIVVGGTANRPKKKKYGAPREKDLSSKDEELFNFWKKSRAGDNVDFIKNKGSRLLGVVESIRKKFLVGGNTKNLKGDVVEHDMTQGFYLIRYVADGDAKEMNEEELSAYLPSGVDPLLFP